MLFQNLAIHPRPNLGQTPIAGLEMPVYSLAAKFEQDQSAVPNSVRE
jgi:hypothetical protein